MRNTTRLILLLVLVLSPPTIALRGMPLAQPREQTVPQSALDGTGTVPSEQVQGDLIVPVLQDETVLSGAQADKNFASVSLALSSSAVSPTRAGTGTMRTRRFNGRVQLDERTLANTISPVSPFP